MKKLNTYLVGGAVRDILLGLDPKDKDYVVVGSSEEELLSLGFEQVGKDFPVFLHPESGYEYALARKEQKTGHGYGGFVVETHNISLEDDLFRRDLTINAMAMSENGQIIDPFGGQEDLKNKILRHVSAHFSEDPVRILRIARFSARYNYQVALPTLEMMSKMVENGEFDHLTAERVWKEFEKVLNEKYLINFFNTLEHIGALDKLGKFSKLKKSLSFLSTIEDSTIEDKELIKLGYIFQEFSSKEMNAWKIPSEHIEKINIYKNWFNNSKFYSALEDKEKISFLKQTKFIHDDRLPLVMAQSILFTLNQHNNDNSEMDFLLQDIKSLKGINYEQISIQAKANKENIGQAIINEQIKSLVSSHHKSINLTLK